MYPSRSRVSNDASPGDDSVQTPRPHHHHFRPSSSDPDKRTTHLSVSSSAVPRRTRALARQPPPPSHRSSDRASHWSVSASISPTSPNRGPASTERYDAGLGFDIIYNLSSARLASSTSCSSVLLVVLLLLLPFALLPPCQHQSCLVPGHVLHQQAFFSSAIDSSSSNSSPSIWPSSRPQCCDVTPSAFPASVASSLPWAPLRPSRTLSAQRLPMP